MKKDETFKSLYKEPQFVGSYYENLRVGHPDEFDLNLELELPVRPENITVSHSFLFVPQSLQNKDQEKRHLSARQGRSDKLI